MAQLQVLYFTSPNLTKLFSLNSVIVRCQIPIVAMLVSFKNTDR